jgi:hypothetical protein
MTSTDNGFSIQIAFGEGMTDALRDVFTKAADRWLKVIVGGLPAVEVKGETVTGLRIEASAGTLDHHHGFSALTEFPPGFFRPKDGSPTASLPTKATIRLDAEDLEDIKNGEGSDAQKHQFLVDLVTHEMGHALGFSKDVWGPKSLFQPNTAENNPLFTGSRATKEYGKLVNNGDPTDVPLESTGLDDPFISHWKQTIFNTELMTFLLEANGNPIGPVTIAALRDLGYPVTMKAAETDALAPGPPPGDGAPGDGGGPILRPSSKFSTSSPYVYRVFCHVGVGK